jgi:hypothetical protein
MHAILPGSNSNDLLMSFLWTARMHFVVDHQQLQAVCLCSSHAAWQARCVMLCALLRGGMLSLLAKCYDS